MRPLHFGHSIESSYGLLCTAVGVQKQVLHQIVAVRNFNMLDDTYLLAVATEGAIASTKMFRESFFVQGG
jgi:hypothetical protein